MADEKPDVKNEPITLKVKDGAGLETIFKVKRTTKFGKIFDAYANKTGQQAAGLRFLFDGNTLDKDSTPGEMEMEEGDAIDVSLQQTGGAF